MEEYSRNLRKEENLVSTIRQTFAIVLGYYIWWGESILSFLQCSPKLNEQKTYFTKIACFLPEIYILDY